MDNYIPIIVAIAFMVIGFVSESKKAKKLKNPGAPSNAKPHARAPQNVARRTAATPQPASNHAKKQRTIMVGNVAIPLPEENPIKVPAANPITVPDAAPIKSFDGEQIKPITFENEKPIDVTIPQMKLAQEADPYAIDHNDFSQEYDWKKAVIASEILKTKF